MAYVKLSLLPLFLLAILFLIFSMKKVEAGCQTLSCGWSTNTCTGSCTCIVVSIPVDYSVCVDRKMAEQLPNYCKSHADCTEKGSGSFCAFYPNLSTENGWCFASSSHAEAFYKKVLRSEFSELLKLKIPSAVST